MSELARDVSIVVQSIFIQLGDPQAEKMPVVSFVIVTRPAYPDSH